MINTTNKIDDGGPVFPTPQEHPELTDWYTVPGMSVRTWLAGMALNGILANSDMLIAAKKLKETSGHSSTSIITATALDYADKLISQLNTDKQPQTTTEDTTQ